jgi:outer membrane protein TolC
MVKILRKIPFIMLLFSLFCAGCGSFDGRANREKHTEDYRDELAAEMNELMFEDKVFGLNDCIQTAMENGLHIKAAQIQEKVAKLERKIAFSSFLPAVNLSYDYTRWDRQPKVKFGASAAAMHDKAIRNITWQMEMSVFDPSTWFLYALHQRGEETAAWITKYTEQMTVLEITVNYYYCLTLEQARGAIESQLRAAEELEKEIGELFNEGLVTQWQYKQAQSAVLVRRTELNRIDYAIKQAKADLLVSMGVSPLADILLKIEEPLTGPGERLEDLVYEAMLANPQLYISDLQIAIAEEKVKIALAAFLPRLTIFANQTNTSDSFQLYQNSWQFGLIGTMSIFNGFANINEYKAAKERKKAEFINREQQTLAVILQVYKAYMNLENAKEEAILSQNLFDTESERFKEESEKWREGLVQSSEMLSVMAEVDNAQMELMNSNFNLQVSIATLHNAMGTTEIPVKEKQL